MKPISFTNLWNSYPTTDSPCSSAKGPNFSNQCAIRVGVALAKQGISGKILGARCCWHHDKKEGHVLAAEELVSALVKVHHLGIGKPIELDAKGFKSKIAGKTGIIFFKDYWMRDKDKEGRPTGDHVDLWNGTRLTARSSWLRVNLGIVILGVWSDFEKSKCVRFFEVK
jgi:hypothetical protein